MMQEKKNQVIHNDIFLFLSSILHWQKWLQLQFVDPLTFTGQRCPKRGCRGRIFLPAVYRNIGVPKTNVFCKQEVSFSNEVKPKV